MCGKKVGICSNTYLYIGLLPLAWEKAHICIIFANTNRNTPTRVGKSKHPFRYFYPNKEHSHSRGKKGITMDVKIDIAGTLPLAWEKDSVFTSKTVYPTKLYHKIFYKLFLYFFSSLARISSSVTGSLFHNMHPTLKALAGGQSLYPFSSFSEKYWFNIASDC